MLKVSLVDFILAILPQSFLLILATYLFSDTKINKKSCLISTLVLAISIFLVRALPIHFGVHIIINMIIYIFISIWINKIPIVNAISVILVITIIIPIFEALSIFLLKNLYNINLDIIFNNAFNKALCSLFTSVLFGVCIVVAYVYKLRKEEK